MTTNDTVRNDLLDAFRLDVHLESETVFRHANGRALATWKRDVRPLGVGGFGIAWTWRDNTGEVRVIKEVQKITPGTEVEYWKREVSAMALLSRNTRDFPQFHGWFEDPTFVFIAMEYFPRKDLWSVVTGPVPNVQTRQIVSQVGQALEAIHSRGITHRDLKPNNIFVRQGPPAWEVVIADFGISKRVQNLDTTLYTPFQGFFSAPETQGITVPGVEKPWEYTNAVDMWSLGCLAYWLLRYRVPFQPAQMQTYCKRDWPSCCDIIDWAEITDTARDCIAALLKPQPLQRPSSSQVSSHEWLSTLSQCSSLEHESSASQTAHEVHPLDAERDSAVPTSEQPETESVNEQTPTPNDIRSNHFSPKDCPAGILTVPAEAPGDEALGPSKTEENILMTQFNRKRRPYVASASNSIPIRESEGRSTVLPGERSENIRSEGYDSKAWDDSSVRGTQGSYLPERTAIKNAGFASDPVNATKDSSWRPKGILKPPRRQPYPGPEVEQVNAATRSDILPRKEVFSLARWTKISNDLVCAEVLESCGERFDEGWDYNVVYRVLSKSEIALFASMTDRIRERRRMGTEAEGSSRWRQDSREQREDRTSASYFDTPAVNKHEECADSTTKTSERSRDRAQQRLKAMSLAGDAALAFKSEYKKDEPNTRWVRAAAAAAAAASSIYSVDHQRVVDNDKSRNVGPPNNQEEEGLSTQENISASGRTESIPEDLLARYDSSSERDPDSLIDSPEDQPGSLPYEQPALSDRFRQRRDGEEYALYHFKKEGRNWARPRVIKTKQLTDDKIADLFRRRLKPSESGKWMLDDRTRYQLGRMSSRRRHALEDFLTGLNHEDRNDENWEIAVIKDDNSEHTKRSSELVTFSVLLHRYVSWGDVLLPHESTALST